jgi:hypothetical protein
VSPREEPLKAEEADGTEYPVPEGDPGALGAGIKPGISPLHDDLPS